MNKFISVLPVVLILLVIGDVSFAADNAEAVAKAGAAPYGKGLAMGLAALGGTLGQGMAARAWFEGVSRNPQAAGAMGTQFYVGLAFIESLVLFALVAVFAGI